MRYVLIKTKSNDLDRLEGVFFLTQRFIVILHTYLKAELVYWVVEHQAVSI
jgi:hypothetical protein